MRNPKTNAKLRNRFRPAYEALESRINLACPYPWLVLTDDSNPFNPVCEPQFSVPPGNSNSVMVIAHPGQKIVIGDQEGELTINGFTYEEIQSSNYEFKHAMFAPVPSAKAIVSLTVQQSNDINLGGIDEQVFSALQWTSLELETYKKEESPGIWIRDGKLKAIGSFARDSVSVGYYSHKMDAEDKLTSSESNQIEISTLGGNDVITSTSRLQGTINTGSGTDTVFVNDADYEYHGFENYLPGDTAWTIQGVGSSLAIIAGGGTVTYAGMEVLQVDLGDGNDSAVLQNLAGLSQSLSIDVMGAEGTDNINASQAGAFPLMLSSGGTPTLPNDQEVVIGGAGNDKITGGEGRDRLDGGGGNDHLWGWDGNDELHGGEGIDKLWGESGNDVIHGDDGNDVIQVGEPGEDQNFGDAGDDEFQLDPDSPNFDGSLDKKTDGGTGTNHLWVAASRGGHQYEIDDVNNSKLALLLDGIKVSEMETVHGVYINSGDDLLPDEFTLNPIADPEDFNLDNDGNVVSWARRPTATLPNLTIVFHGGGGSSTIHEETLASKFHIDPSEFFDAFLIFGGNEADTVTGGLTPMTVVAAGGKDVVTGSMGDDLLLGMDGEDTLNGARGNDVLVGNAGKDRLAGGDHNDWLIDQFPGMWKVVEAKIPSSLLPSFREKVSTAQLKTIETQLDFEGGNNEFFGNDGDDVLIGGTGADILLDGGHGDDVIFGEGFSFDANFIFSNDFFQSYFGSLGKNAQGQFKLSAKLGINPLPGAKDIIKGGDGFDILLGGNGDDEIDAGLGSSIIFGDSISIELASGDLTIGSDSNSATATANYQLLPRISRSGTGNDTITAGSTEGRGGGRPYFNIVVGGNGEDRIFGGDAYVDFLFGNDGNDLDIDGDKFELVKPDSDIIAIDIIVGGDGADVLHGGDYANLLIGDSFEIQAFANLDWESIKNLTFNVGVALLPIDSGFDLITGGSGFDFIVGGDGDDTIWGNTTTSEDLNVVFGDAFQWVVSAGFGAGDEYADSKQQGISENTTNALSLVRSRFTLKGNGGDTYWGGNGVDVVFGGLGNDKLHGGSGWDFLVGEGGNDTLDGGPGIKFELGNETYQALLGGPGNDHITGGDDPDWLESEEGNDVFHGGGGNDIIYGGADADELYGEDGDDQLFGEDGDDLLVGGAGNDEMTGGPGADTYDGGTGVNTTHDSEVVATIKLSRSSIFRDLPAAWVAGLELSIVDTGFVYELSDPRFEIRDRQLYLRSGQKVTETLGSLIPLNITARSGSATVAVGGFQLSVANSPNDWQHAYQWTPNPLDVDVDGTISPLDVLLIINLLNSQGSSKYLPPEVGGTRAPYFYDANGDDFASPLDVLLVINFINQSGNGEGEDKPTSPPRIEFEELGGMHLGFFDWQHLQDELTERAKRFTHR